MLFAERQYTHRIFNPSDWSSRKIMSIPRVAWKASLPGVLAVAVASAVMFTSGCSMSNMTSANPAPLTGAAIQGKVHGGQFPVSGATIGLFVAGSTGYGSSGGSLLTSAVTTGTDGSFSITGDYTCPANSLVYLTASGGNPGLGSNNNAIVLAAPLGACASLSSSTFISVDEVTTAATAIALGQFFTPTFGSSSPDSFGTSATNIPGLTNAFATANSLVNVSTGQAVVSTTLGSGALSVTATPESAKLNTIANILAACVNSDGSGTSPCQTTLFPSVTPASGAAPTDTLQAAVYMSLNPTSNNAATSATNMAALFGLQTGTAPFVGAATQPADWTVGIQYQGASTSTVLSEPQNLAADSNGNIWVVNAPGSASDSLTELSPNGTPLLTTLSGTTQPALDASSLSGSPRNVAIDTLNNVWVTTSSNSGFVYEYNNSNSPGTITDLALGKASYGIAIDGSNDVFVGEESGSATISFYEFLGGNLNADFEVEYPSDESNVQPEYMAIDTSGNLWATSGSVNTAASTVVQLSNINTGSCGAPPFASACALTSSASQNTYTTISGGPMNEPWFPAAGIGGIWVANVSGNNMTFLSLTGSTVNSETNYGSSASVNAPHYIAVDGVGNVWAANKSSGSVAEFSSAGAILSPGTGFAHNGISGGEGITLDPSGNIWVADDTTSGADGFSVFEIVGAAAPTVTPIALALKNSAVAKKP
jgi:hypothetical protein